MMIAMNQNINNFDGVDDELQDDWLNENLKLIQKDPPQGFTGKVVEQIEPVQNPLGNSPLFWILAAVPGMFLIWIIVFIINSLNVNYQLNLNYLPNITSEISLFTLSKYVLMITIGGLFFIGLDYFLNKRLLHKGSFFSFILV
jgi:hypothetical protein